LCSLLVDIPRIVRGKLMRLFQSCYAVPRRLVRKCDHIRVLTAGKSTVEPALKAVLRTKSPLLSSFFPHAPSFPGRLRDTPLQRPILLRKDARICEASNRATGAYNGVFPTMQPRHASRARQIHVAVWLMSRVNVSAEALHLVALRGLKRWRALVLTSIYKTCCKLQ